MADKDRRGDAWRYTRVEVYRDAQGQWRFRGVAKNGETIAQGEAFATRYGARRAALRVFPDGVIDEI